MKTMKQNWQQSYLFGGNADFVEELYDIYLSNPESLEVKWKSYFDSIQDSSIKDVNQQQIKDKFVLLTSNPNFNVVASGGDDVATFKVTQMIDNYRRFGHICTDLDPLQRRKVAASDLLNIAKLGLSDKLEQEFVVSGDGKTKVKLKNIVALLEKTYCGTVGFEYSHISDQAEYLWVKNYIENNYLKYNLSKEEKINLLSKLNEAEGLERFLHTKYVGQKRFSLEGGDVLIPALDRIITQGAKTGVNNVVIGMAHRGRLNSLINITGKAPQKLFDEFDSNYPTYDFVTGGDVKYHKGYKCNYTTPSGVVETSIMYNPSHLEVVNPVVNGIVRAIQDYSDNKLSSVGVLVHGDSALIGLGTNQAVFNMSQTRAYGVNGIIHIVVNNQVGFTTSNQSDNRSSRYSTDISKIIEVPILHVNGDDVESLAFAVDFAVSYRNQFAKDVVIDIVCFRRHGHNEADDPSLTQPFMYRKVKAHPGTRKLYADKLIAEGIITDKDVLDMAESYRAALLKGEHLDKNRMQALPWYDFDLTAMKLASANDVVDSAVAPDKLIQAGTLITTIPENFKPHQTVAKLLETRKSMLRGEVALDYGFAENLAYATLLQQGISVRFSGEDSGRGTFSHRQAIIHDYNSEDFNEGGYNLLQKTENSGSKIEIYDSILNEECVLGFEYGYSTKRLNDLVIWEAQFGDFANGAQVMIDQFVASAESKWGVLSNLVMLLPHGYDGQGPEHSSARLERYLQLCAEKNIKVVVPSTAAQMFHILRVQALTNYKKPLVILLSKKLLRFKEAASNISMLSSGKFETIIADNTTNKQNIKKVIVCSGQVYYDLFKHRQENNLSSVALIRIEQLYPFPLDAISRELASYVNCHSFVWAQEEPYNQGAWLQVCEALDLAVASKNVRFKVSARPSAAAPATGLSTLHSKQLKELIDKAFN